MFTHVAGVTQVLLRDIRAGWANLPGVPKQLWCGLHYALPCGEVILCVSIKVPTQTTNPASQVGFQPHIHTHAFSHRTI